MKKALALCTAAGAAVLSVVAAPSAAETARDLRYLTGQTTDAANKALARRGIQYKTSRQVGVTRQSYWWDNDDRQCIQFISVKGKIASVSDAKAEACGIKSGPSATSQEERDFYDSGFYDGSRANPYHNPRNSAAYSRGYAEGSRSTTGVSTSTTTAAFADLAGARAAGGMTELERRGFRQVDNFVSGTTRYSIQWRAASRQCIQVTMADGKFVSVDDIRTHPKCR